MKKKHQIIIPLIVCVFLLTQVSDLFAQEWRMPFLKADRDSPNILWIVTDQQRWDTIGELNNEFVKTPNIDRLVREGVTFTTAYTQSPICTPSRASFLTGMYPTSVRATRNGAAYWPEAAPLVTAMLSDAGFDGGSVGKLHLSTAQGNKPEIRPLNDGYRVFHFMHAPYQGGSTNDWQMYYKKRGVDVMAYKNELGYVPEQYHPTRWSADRAIDFITERRERPWLMSLNFYDPHGPFDPPPEYIERYDIDALPGPRITDEDLIEKAKFSDVMFQGSEPRDWRGRRGKETQAAYWAQIDLIDEHVGRVLAALEETGQLDNTLIIFTADHGEMLGDHGLRRKGARLYEPLLRVPLIFWYPSKIEQNLQSDALVAAMDIAPTLLELTGLEVPERMQGKSLLPILTGETAPHYHRDYVRAEFYDTLENRPEEGQKEPAFVTMLRDKQYKLITYHGHPEGGELFDLVNDPDEFNNLWNNPDYQDIRFELMLKKFDETVRAIDIGPERIGRY